MSLQVLGRRPVFAFRDLEMLQCVLCDVVPIACAFPMRERKRKGVTSDICVGVLFDAGRCSGEISWMD